MINLLPESEKRELINIERQKVIAIVGALLAFFTIALSLILWVVGLNIASEKTFKEAIAITEERRINSDETILVKTKIITLNESLLKIKGLMDSEEQLTEMIMKISTDVPTGVYLTNISYQGKQFIVSGFAPVREDLLVFKENLEKETSFKNIDFPPVNWVKPRAIIFTVSFVKTDEH
ncbi:MAG: PilN domain-containing protein [bacterium]